MCLIIPTNTESLGKAIKQSKKIATKDIVVYKVVKVGKKWKNQYGEGYKFISLYENFPYKLGYHYYQKDKKFSFNLYSNCVYNSSFILEIYKGLHAYIKLDEIIVLKSTYTDRAIIKCIIPKGSEYFVGTHNDIVTDNLIFDSVVKIIPVYGTKYLWWW